MPEIWFYHLEHKTAAQALPGMLLRGLERGIRMVVCCSDSERVKELSNKIWDYEGAAFIPHGFAGEPFAESQPIFLATDENTPNAASFAFYVDGTMPHSVEKFARASILFDGNDENAKDAARAAWRQFKSQGVTIRYWKQDEQGRWQDQAAS